METITNFFTDWSLARAVVIFLLSYLLFGWALARDLYRGYVFASHLRKIKISEDNKLPPLVWLLGGKEALNATVIDLMFNWMYGTVILWSIPRYWGDQKDVTFSQFMSRFYQEEPDNFRAKRVKWIVDNTRMNVLDPGHIHVRKQ